MPTSNQTLAALLALIISVSAFTAAAITTPPDKLITKDEAIRAIEASPKADPTRQIVSEDNLAGSELQYLAIRWESLLRGWGYHRRIYVSTTPVGDISPYWIISYGKPIFHYSPLGIYVVDARKGELMLAYEDTGGPPQEEDFSVTYVLPSPTQGEGIAVRPGEARSFVVLVTAQPNYDASLPIRIEVKGVPNLILVTQNVTSAVLQTGGRVSVGCSVTAGKAAFNPSIENPSVEVDVTLLGGTHERWFSITAQR